MSNFYKKCDINSDYLGKYENNNSFEISLTRFHNNTPEKVIDTIIAEFPLGLIINDKYHHTFLCSPINMNELVVGYLFYENLISEKNDIILLKIDEINRIANVAIKKISKNNKIKTLYLNDYDYIKTNIVRNNDVTINVSDIYNLMELNLNSSELFKNTAGVHNISICSNKDMIVSFEDVARHNALDKAIGYCILNNITLDNKAIFVSGRLSFEMIRKAAIIGVPIIISKSAITSLVIETAYKLNITLVGFVRNKKMNIYTHPHRIILK